MLTFNLGKSDRVMIHKRIASSNITPKELSLMSSTDLADEETKLSIKIAEKEALEHSILQKTKAPRAKITHKGMVDIEDVNNEGSSMRERERERELEEEEKRERERTARLRAAQAQQRRASSASQGPGSVPPESPIAPHQSWGGPPSLPIHAIQTNVDGPPLSPSLGSAGSPINSMFSPSTSYFNTYAEPQLDLADLINIDEEPSASNTVPDTVSQPPPLGSPVDVTPSTLPSTSPGQSSMSPTGISPFAASVPKPEVSLRSSFDLNALWTGPKADVSTTSASPPPQAQEADKDSFIDVDILGQEADDQDFDMFLEKDQDDQTTHVTVDSSPEAQEVVLNSLPHVWSGKVRQCIVYNINQLLML